ncbi:DgyrCDS10465 [Dimorphilus gyrociliatus]|uniref:DgyrCDS10465 n=1 Tax=Dimorphilus gyrociliatus TaxID=2664684 RepID=A0A7I8W0D6_9ANNE|nr:DgyrCDS10465 [Dimorphilus gyrociliatus]
MDWSQLEAARSMWSLYTPPSPNPPAKFNRKCSSVSNLAVTDHTSMVNIPESRIVLHEEAIQPEPKNSKVLLPDSNNFSNPKLGKNQIKNLIALSSSFALLYLAFFSLRNLQSSLHSTGIHSLAAMYISYIVGCFFAAPALSLIGPKWAILSGMLSVLVYIGSMFFPDLLIPANVLLGILLAFMWIAQGSYLTTIAMEFAQKTIRPVRAVLGLFNGTFLFLLHLSQIAGNLISSAVLSPTIELTNSSEAIPNHTAETCGVEFCHNQDSTTSQQKLQIDSFTILIILFAAVSITGVIVLIAFLDQKKEKRQMLGKRAACMQIMTILEIHKDFKLLLLIPLMIYVGMQEALIFGEFTRAYVSCLLGLHRIGYIMAVFGTADAVGSIVFGKLQKYVPINGFVAIAVCANSATLCAMFLWDPKPDFLVCSLFACALGIGDAIWQTQFFSLCGILFEGKTDQAFSSLRLYEASGFAISCLYSTTLCMKFKFYIMFVMLVLGVACYVAMNVIKNLNKPKKTNVNVIQVLFVGDNGVKDRLTG